MRWVLKPRGGYHLHTAAVDAVPEFCQLRAPVLFSVRVPQIASVKGALGVAVRRKQAASGQPAGLLAVIV